MHKQDDLVDNRAQPFQICVLVLEVCAEAIRGRSHNGIGVSDISSAGHLGVRDEHEPLNFVSPDTSITFDAQNRKESLEHL